jgi:hypothetical protein
MLCFRLYLPFVNVFMFVYMHVYTSIYLFDDAFIYDTYPHIALCAIGRRPYMHGGAGRGRLGAGGGCIGVG